MPEKRKLPKALAAQIALDRAMRELWATGIHRFSQLCVCRGRIVLVPDKEGVIYTELWGTGVYLNIYWFADTIPPTIQNGKIATIVGNVQTYNLNDHVALRNCLHVPRYGAQMKREIRELIAKFVLTPKTYMPEEHLDAVREKIKAKRKARLEQSKNRKTT